MQKSIFLLIFTLYSIVMFAQKYEIEESTLAFMHQNNGTPEQLTNQVYNKLIDSEDILSGTSVPERCFFYTYFYLYDAVFKTKGNQNLKKDIRKIFTEQVSLTYSEFDCFFDGLGGGRVHESCDLSKRKVMCKINKYLFSKVEEVFKLPKKFKISSLRNAEIEVEDEYGDKYEISFSEDGLFLNVIDRGIKDRYVEKVFDECGFLDTTFTYNLNNNLSGIDYERNSNRDWYGKERFYSNGKLYLSSKKNVDLKYYLNYTLDLEGDTLSYLYIDERGVDKIRQTYTKDLNGNISSVNGSGIINTFSMENDSVYISKAKESFSSSMFYYLKEYYNLDTKEILFLDTIFTAQFSYNLASDVDQCIENYEDALSKVPKYDTINLKPFIQISCEINDGVFEEESTEPKVTSLTTSEMLSYRELFRKEMWAQDNVRHPDEWGNDSDFVKFMKPKVDSTLLVSIYKKSLVKAVGRAKLYNIPNNDYFKGSLEKLTSIIDTLGDNFLLVKQRTNKAFIESLDENEKSILMDVSTTYKDVISDYYIRLYTDNWKKSYGFEKNRMDYYQLITDLQLKHPNQRLFNQNNKSRKPVGIDSIFERYDEYLGEDRYQVILEAEKALFKSMEGMNNFTVTPYNPYFMEREEKKREFRRFNWLIN